MFRGTTPKLELEIDFDPKELVNLYITFEQKEKVVLEKSLEDCHIVDNVIICPLTQDDTLKFVPTNDRSGAKRWLYIQARATLQNGEAMSTPIGRYEVERILKEGII